MKCGSTNVDLQRDQRAFVSDGRNQVLLHCYTCGHVIYGESKVQAECNRQYAEWESAQRMSGVPVVSSSGTQDAARKGSSSDDSGDAGLAAGAAGAAGVAEMYADFPFKPGDRDSVTGLIFVFPPGPPPVDARGRPLKPCVWPPCDKYARPRSKYCSRNCSNKNARARYSKRGS